ncbi:DNase I-like protein [Durotheca rogersii]|uniref:DNase I-like protein n=1 Tax=Durotheca rogersii TaxID=419775 RepID=UPI00221EFB53|nr:DNase I-like protein [Durotheca rogersii]KAI5867180.1 DNase I-like protein [Durotheca rogersii]
MESHGQDGPDGSSLKPVSSLRSHFENMTKSKDGLKDSPAPAPPTRNQSPSSIPPPVPDTRPSRTVNVPQENGWAKQPKDVANSSAPRLQNPGDAGPGYRSSVHIIAPPPLSPRPIKPPAVLVEPPQSPPKPRPFSMLQSDTTARLNPDISKTPTTPTAPSPRSFKMPTRPNTPIVEPGRAPRPPVVSQPPSPPPPRRSAELRREREARASPPIPPPINRAEKPANRLSRLMGNAPKLEMSPQVPDRRSPFNSPPTTASSPEIEEPPLVPNRPARPLSQKVPPRVIPITFDPPPVHLTIANIRRDQEANGIARTPIATQFSDDRSAPALPARPQTVPDPASARAPANAPLKPPPRPPRPTVATVSPSVDAPVSSQAARAVSTPTTQFAPPPSRTHGRSLTVDKGAEKIPADGHEPSRRPAASHPNGHPSDSPVSGTTSHTEIITQFPDSAKINRRPPVIKQGAHEINTKYDTRVFDVCGQYVCTAGQFTRVWSLLDGEQVVSFAHGEGVRATAVSFKPTLDIQDEGMRLWIGNNVGELVEADVGTQSIVGNKTNAHGRNEIIKIYRYYNEMWSLDDGGTLHVWGPDDEGIPNLAINPHQTYRLPKGHTFSIIVDGELWHATGKEIRIFAPTANGRNQVQVLMRPLVAEGAGEVTSGALLKSQPGKVFFGHNDGKVSIYSQKDFACLSVLNVSTYKINSLVGVGGRMWAAYNTGKICVYDVSESPWVVKKDWQAHSNPVVKLVADPASFYKLDRSQVVSLGADNTVRSWDGLLQDDFLETEMKTLDKQYCQFEDIKLLAMTWNAGASTPNSLRYSDSDAMFMQNLLQSSDSPDILVFGFQELVDLEDKTATAKRFFKPKKKDATDQERMSHQYRDWRDFLVRCLDDFLPSSLYHLLQTTTLVGLFTCIFVKSTLRDRIRNLGSAEIKRGMGGLHGNKGAIVVRFMVDDTSLCFINCHLAAGQSQANHRHNDIAAIMESALLPGERDPSVRIDSYVGGGDGTMVLDHELCLLNGDLNYRIDTMSRDTVVIAVKQNNLAKLLERDQLLVARRRNPAFKLRAFEEMPIEFAPTYKYDVGTDTYDSSEKKRSPAWCDRLLHRGSGRIRQLDYRRHEVRVSDHRPVTGQFKFTVKTISPQKRTLAWADCQQRFEDLRGKEASEEMLNYLTKFIGFDMETSTELLQEKAARRDHRSPSRLNE